MWGAKHQKQQWFQQDGATPHTANVPMQWIKARFGKRVISRRSEHSWASHSPDLNSCDFYLWGYLKDVIMFEQFQNLNQLRQEVSRQVKRIKEEQCQRVMKNFVRRLKVCIERNGMHLEHVL